MRHAFTGLVVNCLTIYFMIPNYSYLKIEWKSSKKSFLPVDFVVTNTEKKKGTRLCAWKMEMAGIEPASERLDQRTSTSVVFCITSLVDLHEDKRIN